MIDTLFKELAKNSVMLLSMHGVRTVLERELGIKELKLSMDETVRAEIERDHTAHEKAKYPYAYMAVSELMGVRDQGNNKYSQRMGVRMMGQAGADGATRATSRKAHLFPINLSLDLKYVHDDPLKILLMGEAFTILSVCGGLSFNLQLNEGYNFDVRIEIPESTTIPIASTTDTSNPGGFELSMSLIVHTYSGFFHDASAVNSGSANINFEIDVGGQKISTVL